MAFILQAIGLVDTIPNFPYKIDEASPHASFPCSFTNALTWTLQDGIATDISLASTASPLSQQTHLSAKEKEEAQKVSIFHVSLKGLSPEAKQLARNALKRVLTLRINGLLKCLAAAEHRDHIYIATERCVPLEHYLSHLKEFSLTNTVGSGGGGGGGGNESMHAGASFLSPDEMGLGVKHLARGVHALHLNALVHGNAYPRSAFVTLKGRFWKLFGFELISCVGGSATPEEVACFVHGAQSLPSTPTLAPEMASCVSAGSSAQLRELLTTPSSAVSLDAWGIAVVMYEAGKALKPPPGGGATMGHLPQSLTPETARECARCLPAGLRQGFQALCAANPATRPRVQSFVDSNTFFVDNRFIQIMELTENYEVIEAEEREGLLHTLAREFAPSNASPRFPLHGSLWIMERILSQLHIFTPKNVVLPVVLMGMHIPEPAVYDTAVGPLLGRLYCSRDKFVRLQLLQALPFYCDKLDAVRLAQVIWAQFGEGFRSNSPDLLTLTARGSVLLAKRLPARVVGTELTNALGSLLSNSDPSMRANAIRCFTEIAELIPVTSRELTLGSVFTKAVKDPERAVRYAAVNGLASFLAWMSPHQIASILLPSVLPLTVDSFRHTRDVALNILSKGVDKLRQAAAENVESGQESNQEMVDASGRRIEMWSFDVAEVMQEAKRALFDDNDDFATRRPIRDVFSDKSGSRDPDSQRQPARLAGAASLPSGTRSGAAMPSKVGGLAATSRSGVVTAMGKHPPRPPSQASEQAVKPRKQEEEWGDGGSGWSDEEDAETSAAPTANSLISCHPTGRGLTLKQLRRGDDLGDSGLKKKGLGGVGVLSSAARPPAPGGHVDPHNVLGGHNNSGSSQPSPPPRSGGGGDHAGSGGDGGGGGGGGWSDDEDWGSDGVVSSTPPLPQSGVQRLSTGSNPAMALPRTHSNTNDDKPVGAVLSSSSPLSSNGSSSRVGGTSHTTTPIPSSVQTAAADARKSGLRQFASPVLSSNGSVASSTAPHSPVLNGSLSNPTFAAPRKEGSDTTITGMKLKKKSLGARKCD